MGSIHHLSSRDASGKAGREKAKLFTSQVRRNPLWIRKRLE
jgi:hypothetical protein